MKTRHLLTMTLLAGSVFGAANDAKILRDEGSGFNFNTYTITDDAITLLAAPDSNPFTDADETKLDNLQDFTAIEAAKLAGIEDNATADQTNAEILTAWEAATLRTVATDGAKLDGIQAGAQVTDLETVRTAGALMDDEVLYLSQVKNFSDALYVHKTGIETMTGPKTFQTLAALTPVTIDAAISQTADLTQWRDSADAVMNVVAADGDVGIGTAAPTSTLQVGDASNMKSTSLFGALSSSNYYNTNGSFTASSFTSTILAPTNKITNFNTLTQVRNGSSVNEITGFKIGLSGLAGTETVGTNYGFKMETPATIGVTNLYGIHLGDMSVGTTNGYAIYSEGGDSYFAGNVGIGQTVPTSKLEVAGDVLIADGTAVTLELGTIGVGGSKINFASNDTYLSDGELKFGSASGLVTANKYKSRSDAATMSFSTVAVTDALAIEGATGDVTIANDLEVTGGITTSSITSTAATYNQPNFLNPVAGDNLWAYGSAQFGSEYWMQAKYAGNATNTRGFRVLNANGDVPVFETNEIETYILGNLVAEGAANIDGVLTLGDEFTSGVLKFENAYGSQTTITNNNSYSNTYQLPDIGGTTTADFVLTQGTQTINGAKKFTQETQFTNGITNPGNVLSFEGGAFAMDGTETEFFVGWDGSKGAITIAQGFGSLSKIINNSQSNNNYNLPDISGPTTADFVVTEGAQTINGVKTFTQQTKFTNDITNPTGILTFEGGTFAMDGAEGEFIIGDAGEKADLTLANGFGNYSSIATSDTVTRYFNMPYIDTVATDVDFVVTEGTQTINGAKTFGTSIALSSGPSVHTIDAVLTDSTDSIPTSGAVDSDYVRRTSYGGLYANVDTTITTSATQGDYVQVTGWDGTFFGSGLISTLATDDISIDETGLYQISLNVSFSGTINERIAFAVTKGTATPIAGLTFERTLGGDGSVGSASLQGIALLLAGDDIEVWVAAPDGTSKSVTVTDGQFMARQLD